MATAKKRTTSTGPTAKKQASTVKQASTAKKSGGGTTKTTTSRATGARGGSRGSGPRELIDTGTDKRYVRRDAEGQFKESDDVGRSLAADARRKATTPAKAGQGDRGDRKP